MYKEKKKRKKKGGGGKEAVDCRGLDEDNLQETYFVHMAITRPAVVEATGLRKPQPHTHNA